jgi:hypothetical protein
MRTILAAAVLLLAITPALAGWRTALEYMNQLGQSAQSAPAWVPPPPPPPPAGYGPTHQYLEDQWVWQHQMWEWQQQR